MVNVVACIKARPGDADIHISRRTGRPEVDPEKLVMGNLSRRAIDAGLKAASGVPNSSVTAVTVGGPETEPMLREALAMGCHKAIRLYDKVLVESDDLGVARALGAAIRKIGDVDLVTTGARTADRYAGQVGPQLSAILGLNLITYASTLELADGGLVATKTLQGPDVARVRSPLPAVVTIGDRYPAGRHPTTWGIKAAYAKPVTVWGLQDVGLPLDVVGPAASVTVLQKVERVQERERANEVITGTPDEAAVTVVRRLRARGLLR